MLIFYVIKYFIEKMAYVVKRTSWCIARFFVVVITMRGCEWCKYKKWHYKYGKDPQTLINLSSGEVLYKHCELPDDKFLNCTCSITRIHFERSK